MAAIPEDEMVAFCGALFAIAATDGVLEREEVDVLFDLMDLTEFALSSRRAVLSFAACPPGFAECLEDLQDSELRFSLYMHLIAVVDADGFIADEERLPRNRTQSHPTSLPYPHPKREYFSSYLVSWKLETVDNCRNWHTSIYLVERAPPVRIYQATFLSGTTFQDTRSAPMRSRCCSGGRPVRAS